MKNSSLLCEIEYEYLLLHTFSKEFPDSSIDHFCYKRVFNDTLIIDKWFEYKVDTMKRKRVPDYESLIRADTFYYENDKIYYKIHGTRLIFFDKEKFHKGIPTIRIKALKDTMALFVVYIPIETEIYENMLLYKYSMYFDPYNTSLELNKDHFDPNGKLNIQKVYDDMLEKVKSNKERYLYNYIYFHPKYGNVKINRKLAGKDAYMIISRESKGCDQIIFEK